MADAPHPPVPPASDETDAPARVLVVDDEPSVVDVFREFLSGEGYELGVATSGEEALRLIPTFRPDIILTDINLPGLSGLEVMRFAKSVDPEVAVIVVTGYASASTAIDALRQGAYDYVTKPFDLDDVQQIVERGIANRRLKAINRRLVAELRLKNEQLQRHETELRERVRLATWQMTTLYEVGQEIGANLELAPRLDLIVARAAEFTGAPAGVIYLRNPDTEGFHPDAAYGVPLSARDDHQEGQREAEHALGAAGEGRPVRAVRDPGEPALTLPGVPGAPVESLLAVPLVAEGQTLGVLVALNKPGGFSADDESFLALFAAQAAVAVRNSQLYEHTKSLDRLKSEFVAVVSHEIRTPLTSVKGAVELLSDERYFKNNDQQTKLLTIALANADRLLVLINDILDFSKLENASLPMSMERQRLEPVVHQAAHNLRTVVEEKRIHLEFLLAPDLPDLMMDSNRIAQVLTNLLSNAIKFSPTGGRIVLMAETWEGGAVRVGVRDHGEGIAKENLPRLFRKFSQIDSSSTRKAGGTGLGLVISKGIVEQHGGRIWVESTPGEGSTFYFTLPGADRGVAGAEGAGTRRAAAA
uniref:histidine kinase n=1 Tax=Eiseniibacteriota bacterium TaxID=2212470 RepID=A0A832MIU1_UNCEI